MDPAEHHEVMGVAVGVQGGLVCHFAGVWRRGLLGDDEVGYEEGVLEEGAGEDAAGFEILGGLWGGEREEAVAEGGGKE